MLKIDHLCKNYGSFPALKDLSLEIPAGLLASFHPEKGKWVTAAGVYGVRVGTNAEKAILTGKFRRD